MSKKTYKIHANQGVKMGDIFIAQDTTVEVSEETYTKLQKTRFFKQKILVEIKEKVKQEEKGEKGTPDKK